MTTVTRAGDLPLRAQRWTPFFYSIDFPGFDFTSATFKLQVRQYRDASGDPLIDITNASAGAEGLSVTTAVDDGITTSTVLIQINETTIEGVLPLASSGRPADDPDVPLVWDLHVTLSGKKQRWLEGSFTIIAGVTQ